MENVDDRRVWSQTEEACIQCGEQWLRIMRMKGKAFLSWGGVFFSSFMERRGRTLPQLIGNHKSLQMITLWYHHPFSETNYVTFPSKG